MAMASITHQPPAGITTYPCYRYRTSGLRWLIARTYGRERRRMRQGQRRPTDATYLAFDTEITGLHPIVHRLVEAASVCFQLDGHER